MAFDAAAFSVCPGGDLEGTGGTERVKSRAAAKVEGMWIGPGREWDWP